MAIDNAIVIVFLLGNLFIGWRVRHRIKSFEHFAVGHRSFHWIIIFMTLSATFLGGGYTMGNAGKVFSSSMIFAFALFGFSIKEILVGIFIAPKMKQYADCISVGDIMGRHYGRLAQVITGLFSIMICGGVLGAQVGALGAVVATFFHLPVVISIFMGYGVMAAYSALGGMFAVVYTDVLQFIILIIGIPLIAFFGVSHFGGFQAFTESIPAEKIFFIRDQHDIAGFIMLFIAFFFGEALLPPYAQRLFMSKDMTKTRKSIIMSGIISMPFFLITGFIGLIAYKINSNIDPNNALLTVVGTVLPTIIKGFVIAAIFSVILSSTSSFLNSGVIALVNDVIKPLDKHKHHEKWLLVIARVTTLLIGAIAIILALKIHNILDICLYAYNFWSPIILIPLVAAIFRVKSSLRHFVLAAIVGMMCTYLWSKYTSDIHAQCSAAIGCLCSLITFICHRILDSSLK